ncbi:hypothetical protein K501DRAFT_338503 [Backusella circina FSU 941]|nr:hypothetical protein K501DRAFT_338503 [Backusella circina FSU 941]
MEQIIRSPAVVRSKNYLKKRLLFHRKQDSQHETNSFMSSSNPEVSPNVVRSYQGDDPSYDNLADARSTPILFSNHHRESSSTDGSGQSVHSAHSRGYSRDNVSSRQFHNNSKRWFTEQGRRLSTPSIRSAMSAGRQTLRSLRMRRINLMMNKQSLPEFETEAYCTNCEKYLQTRVRYRNGSMVWLMVFILLMCTVFLFWVPFYVKYFKDVSHYCPGCGRKLGTYHRI